MSASTPERLTISLRRIVVLSAGLYYLHWVYRTWGQLAREAPGHGPYHPVWHALTLLVPVYAQFRMHRHTDLIRALASESFPELRLNPWTIVVLLAAATALVFLGFGITSPVLVLALLVTNVALVTPAMVWPQRALNRYWVATRGPGVRPASLGFWEVVLTVSGLVLVWPTPFALTLLEDALAGMVV